MNYDIFSIATALLIAGGVGMLTGIFGAGGGFILTPALIIILKINPAIAVGTSLLMIVCTSSISMVRRRGSSTMDWKLAGVLCIGALAGVFAGKRLMLRMEALPPLNIRGRPLPTAEYALLWLFLFLLVFIAWFLWFDHFKNRGKPPAARAGWLQQFNLPPMIGFASLESPMLSATILLGLGALAGIMTGLLGIGGGVIWLPALIYLVGQRAVRAAGTSLILVWLSSLCGAALYVKSGHIDLPLWMLLTAGGLAGAWMGTPIGLIISETRLRISFIYVVCAAALMVAVKLAAMTFG